MSQLRLLFLPCLFCSFSLWAAEVQVAVASNFYHPMKRLVADFEQLSDHQLKLSAGSTGSLFAQIQNGAPYDVFLAADQRRPRALVENGLAIATTQFTYAQGQLALWSPQAERVDQAGEVLLSKSLTQLAIANPKTAPYGMAATEVMQRLGVYGKLKSKLVQGKSISQTYQYLMSGVVPMGFVAFSQVSRHGELLSGSVWRVPDSLHRPLNQDMVLLKRGENNRAAKALLNYLKSERAQAIIHSFGYR